MSCERAREWILDALVGELGAAERRQLDDHLDDCASCSQEGHRWEALWRDLGEAALPRPSAGGLERLKASVEKEPPSALGVSAREPRGRPLWRWAAGVLLSLGLGLLLGWGLWAPGEPRPEGPSAPGVRYMMILSSTREAPEQADEVSAAMRTWFATLSERGIVESFVGIADEPAVGVPPDRSLLAADIGGLIVFRASSSEEARRIALSSPSIAYGGEVEVRRLD